MLIYAEAVIDVHTSKTTYTWTRITIIDFWYFAFFSYYISPCIHRHNRYILIVVNHRTTLPGTLGPERFEDESMHIFFVLDISIRSVVIFFLKSYIYHIIHALVFISHCYLLEHVPESLLFLSFSPSQNAPESATPSSWPTE